MEPDDAKISCSFCRKSQDEVRKLIAGPKVYICDECVDLCNDILEQESDLGSAEETTTVAGPIARCRLCGLPKGVGEVRAIEEDRLLCVECIEAVRSVIEAGTTKGSGRA